VVKKSVLILLLLVSCSGALATPTLEGQMEIDHLLNFTGASGCSFYRNRVWFGSIKAEQHLRDKYEFTKSSLSNAEDFIQFAASKSSLTGQPYQVKCGSAATESSAQWLTEELLEFRVITRKPQ
jgi:hypothetical protein